MRVQIDEGCLISEDGRFDVVCDLTECFPDGGEEYDYALAELQRTGIYQGGGGAMPVFRLSRVD